MDEAGLFDHFIKLDALISGSLNENIKRDTAGFYSVF
jgi:hypothetical protein